MSEVPWWRRWWTTFDLESTAPDAYTARIVQAAVIHVNAGNPAEPPNARVWLADPGVPIPEEATAVHGITTEQAQAKGQPADEVIGLVLTELYKAEADDRPLIVMNARYDLTVLRLEMVRHQIGGRLPRCWVIDPLVIDRQLDKYRKGKRTLIDLCEHYDVRFDGDAHNAGADALATAKLTYRMVHAMPMLQEHGLEQLHRAQVGWAAEQARHLQEFYRSDKAKDPKYDSYDPAAVVSQEWPILPIPEGEIMPGVDWDRCRADECRAWIRMLPTDRGSTMPIDWDPVPDGNVVIVGWPDIGDHPTAHVLRGGEPVMEGQPRYVAHFTTCPASERYRNRDKT